MLPAGSSSSLRAYGWVVLVLCFSFSLLFLVMSRQDAVFLDDTLPDTTRHSVPDINVYDDNSPHQHQHQPGKHHRHSFRGSFSQPELLWAPTYRVASDHYQIAADEGPSHCAGKKYTWEACPGPSPSHINASLQHGIFELHCPPGVVGFYSVDIHGNGTHWNEYPGHPVVTDATAVIARCTTHDCEKFLDSQHMCPKDDVFLTQVLLRPDVSARRVDVNLPLNVLVLFTDSAPRADYIASLLQTEKVLRELEETDHHTTFSFPFYNVIGQGTKRWFYAAMGRNSTANPSTFSPAPEGKVGIPWVWEQFRGHGYATGISMEGCWCGETEDFFRSYPYGGPSEDWGTNWNYYEELGDYQLMNVFCAVDVKDGSYRRDNTQYDVELDDAPICLGGDYQSNKFYEWGFQFIDAQERMNRDGHRDALPNAGQRVQPWYLYHQTMYAHGPSACSGMQFTDMQMAKYIRRLHKHGYLNNTMLVLVSDHGNGYFYDNPFLSLTVPNSVLDARPEIGRSLEQNQHQLISGYDIYMTLTHLLNYPSEYHHPQFDDYAKRHNGQSPPGRSLLSAINQHRSCDDVGVPSTSCCVGQFELEKLDVEDKAVVRMARQALEFVNNETESFRSACHVWTFARVLEAKRLGDAEVVIYQTRENQGRFKASFASGRLVSVKQLSIWNPNKKCMPNGVRMEFCQCLPVTISD